MMKRHQFITLLGGAAAAWPLSVRAQQPTMPVIVFLHPGVSEVGARDVAAFRKGLQETGYVEGQNATVEYHWLEEHELVPKAARIAVLVNPTNTTATENALRDLREAAPIIGLQIQVLKATTIAEIDAAFAMLARERPDALFVGPDGFFATRRVQFAILAARERIPAAYTQRGYVAAGGLMSYGSDQVEMIRQAGAHTGSILKGAKPADLPVLQSTKFEFVINVQTARALGIDIPPRVLALADEVIE
jgi:putative ABC transport system substrate-binding protein